MCLVRFVALWCYCCLVPCTRQHRFQGQLVGAVRRGSTIDENGRIILEEEYEQELSESDVSEEEEEQELIASDVSEEEEEQELNASDVSDHAENEATEVEVLQARLRDALLKPVESAALEVEVLRAQLKDALLKSIESDPLEKDVTRLEKVLAKVIGDEKPQVIERDLIEPLCGQGLRSKYCAEDPKRNKLTLILSRHGQKTTSWFPHLHSCLGKHERDLLRQKDGDSKWSNPVLIGSEAEQQAQWEKMYESTPGDLPRSAIVCEQKIGEAFAEYYRPEGSDRLQTWFFAYSDVDSRDKHTCEAFATGYTDANEWDPGFGTWCQHVDESFLAEGKKLPNCNGQQTPDGSRAHADEIDLDDYRSDPSAVQKHLYMFEKDILPIIADIARMVNFAAFASAAGENASVMASRFGLPLLVRILNHDPDGRPKTDLEEIRKYYQHIDEDSAARVACKYTEMAVNEYLASQVVKPFFISFNDALGIDVHSLSTWMNVCYWQWDIYKSLHNARVILADFIVHLHAAISEAVGRPVPNRPTTIRHNMRGPGGLILYMSHDVNVHMLAKLLDSRQWPMDNNNVFHLPRAAVPYHVRIAIEVTEHDHVQLKVFAPTLEQARDRFYGHRIEEDQNMQLLYFKCGGAHVNICPVDKFLNQLAIIYRDSQVLLRSKGKREGKEKSPGRCVSDGSTEHGYYMIQSIT